MLTQIRKKTEQVKDRHVFLEIYWLLWSFDLFFFDTKRNSELI